MKVGLKALQHVINALGKERIEAFHGISKFLAAIVCMSSTSTGGKAVTLPHILLLLKALIQFLEGTRIDFTIYGPIRSCTRII